MKKLFLILLLLGCPLAAHAQQSQIITTCGQLSLSPGNSLTFMDHTGSLCTSGGSGGVVSTSPLSFQQTVTTSAVALATNTYSVGIVITALTTNTGTEYVGASGETTSTGYPLLPGQSISYAVSNSNLVYVIGTAGDKVAVTGN